MLFNEDQKNFMRARFQEFNYPTTKQCELWGQEIQLTGTQVCSFIIKERAFSKPGFRERQNERKRERRKGGPKVSRFRALSPPVERTEHQKKVALKTLKKIYQETDRPTLPMKKQIAEVLLTTPKNINKFFDYHRNKEQNEGKFVKIDKEISKKLDELFKINPNPTTERKKEIAEANKLKLQAVSHWFKTKRDRLKNPEKWDKINEKKRIMGREQRRKMKAQNQKKKLIKKMKTLQNHQEDQEELSGNKDGNSQEVKKMPMKRKIAEVLLTKNKTINRFLKYRQKKDQNNEKYVKINKEISKKLEEEFEINPNPTTERKKEIAEANKLKLQSVSHWFVTKRDRLKNPEKWDKINEKKRIMGREQRRKMKAQNQALGYFRMRRNMDRKRIKKVPEEKDVPEFKGVWIRRQKEQVINQEEGYDESDESDDNSDDSDDSEDMDMHNSGSENFDSDESFTNSDEWDSDDDDKVDEFVKREPKEEPEDE
ncbi:hypothetical protein GCK72_020351 [Caenorhabditis remanei]|uniref:Homeobox domain-containing protein n=1 Tax=Caenorhabditis remanei TaxID=31234 RepID=A0A6A5GGA6_CAERE|nr:hypothetical protein GCK72_020351 [Caenorhabditis remanei]KAF1753794.1 hypothetical protein GCK72_020351 [Caenorhabditis remanei]